MQQPLDHTWHVTAQTQTTQPDQNGRFVPGVNVTWATDSGLSGQVFIPMPRYNRPNVMAEIEAAVRRAIDVQSLRGTVKA